MNILNYNKFLIISHTRASGPTQEIRDYFIKYKVTFAFLEHPFSFNKRERNSRITYFRRGRKIKSIEGIKINGPDLLWYLKDIFYTLYFIIKGSEKYNYCIAADNLNAFSAWLLKKIGFVNKVIYWTIDYSPRRFENKLLNYIYHLIDRFCCYNSDLLWVSSPRMKDARQKKGYNIERCAEELVVRDGCHFERIERLADKEVNKFKLVFMGLLSERKGVDLLIKALPELLKDYPRVTLTIIGTGPEEEKLQNLVLELGIKNKVFFTGFIKEHYILEKTIASCGIAFAPYNPDPYNYTFFSDVMKVKTYLACGLPVLITKVPEIAEEIQSRKAGLIIKYDKRDLVQKTKQLLVDKETFLNCRFQAIKFAKELSWDRVFRDAMKETVQILK